MFLTQEQLARQQLIMKHFGFYRGNIDGIWSRTSIEAKRQFEFSKEFAPAFPNRGLPLDQTARLPRGIILDPANRNLLTHVSFTDDRIAELMGETVKKVEKVSVEKTDEQPKQDFVKRNVPEEEVKNTEPSKQERHKHRR